MGWRSIYQIVEEGVSDTFDHDINPPHLFFTDELF